ncbi:hypothetical protein [Amycolatopsis thermophila]|uniref:Uncharacterized protein n=1 Tax=Amycolatopsis thermophila TaxID=206084 RepID=A0ABU0EMH1_9PSEU|nr:hypothetical protein [Amycolatopsis thermophila]MDQ0376490.1 hypothetical protein [Amycolatopsis thermophila]
MALGCGKHKAIVVDRDTGHKVLEVAKPLRVEWTRVRNNTSHAEVRVPSGACCDELTNVRPWRHELVIYRTEGGPYEPVWQGPIVPIDAESDVATLYAEDGWAWLDVRYPRADMTVSDEVTAAALTLIKAGLNHPDGAGDETGILSAPLIYPTEVHTEREFHAYQSSVGASLRQMTGSALNVTFLGKRLILWGPQPLGKTDLLQDKDFLNGLKVTHDGNAAVSRAIVLGKDGIRAEYGGTDPYYGLIERVINDSTIADQTTALEVARRQVEMGMPPPLYISFGNEARLSDTAPVTIRELVPGVVLPVWTEATCYQVYQDMVLDRLTVVEETDEDGGGETVSVGLANLETSVEAISGVLA